MLSLESTGVHMIRTFLLGGCALFAAGCDRGVELNNASVEEVAASMRKSGADEKFIDPGKWQQSVSMLSIDAPAMPAEARAAMQQAMSKPQVNEVCLTPEQAKSPREEFFTGKDQNCRYDHFKWGGGKIDLKLNCERSNAQQTMALVGDYRPRSYSMTMTVTNRGSAPAEQLAMKMKVDARHVGPCTAKASDAP